MPCAGLLGVRDALFAALKLDIFMCHADRVRLTNIDPDCPLAIVPTIAGKRIRAITGQVLTAATVDAVNTVAAPDAVAPWPIAARLVGGKPMLLLPPKSVSVVEVTFAP